MRVLRLAVAALALLPGAAAAQAPELSLPLACIPGETCFVQNYVDVDPGSAYADFTCGRKTYDGHDGTDFRIPPPPAPGVDVVAAADGVVVATRDGEPDRSFQGKLAAASERGLGNAVVIRHAGGLTTSYGHMANGSVRVAKGDPVRRGEPVGRVGASGLTEFHHVHFGVREGNTDDDPFTGRAVGAGCGTGAPLWTAETAAALAAAARPQIVAVGFNDAPVTPGMIEDGATKVEIGTDAGAFVAWGLASGTDKGDEIVISLAGPDTQLDDRSVEDTPRAQTMRFVGRRRPPGAGVYTVRFAVVRGGETIASREASMTVR